MTAERKMSTVQFHIVKNTMTRYFYGFAELLYNLHKPHVCLMVDSKAMIFLCNLTQKLSD